MKTGDSKEIFPHCHNGADINMMVNLFNTIEAVLPDSLPATKTKDNSTFTSYILYKCQDKGIAVESMQTKLPCIN